MEIEGRGGLDVRMAVEALRNGVPNSAAVQELGCKQPAAQDRFLQILQAAADQAELSGGMLVSGDFGTGKSHLLEHLEHLALTQGFVCSKVSISKETPFYDLGKVFTSAMENGRTPDGRGRFIERLCHAIDWTSCDYGAFSGWADQEASRGVLSALFPASLSVYEKLEDNALRADIESFWAGDRILIGKVKRGLREVGEQGTWSFRAPRAADLMPQRLRFMVELIRCAGYRGWVVLLDELELIGSYSILQRGRAYAETARWMGRARGEAYPGLVVVGAVTSDFASAIISPDGQRKDRDYVPARLEQNVRYRDIAGRAATGMRLLERECVALAAPDSDDVKATMESLRRLYRRAYGWEPPPSQAVAGGAGFMGRMRYKVRAAINEWDLQRLQVADVPDTEFVAFDSSYDEDAALEQDTGGS
ncbi:MAG: DUF2791 family P-loop domain-containing protein [bacterium]|nr:DUF2791 family P-loop domain-containing protein [bacterium]